MQKQKNKKNIFGGHRMLLAGVLCLFGFCLLAQKPIQNRKQKVQTDTTKVQKAPATAPQKQPAKSKVYLIHSDLLRKDSRHPDAQVVVGNVVFRHDSVYMYCDSAYYYDKISSFEAFSNVKMNQGDTLFLYGDRLYYDGNTQIAEVRMNVRMENRNTTLLTDSLNYDRVYNLGYFFDGGTLMDEQNVLTSEWGQYNPGTKQSVFNYNVKLVNPQFTLTSDTLEYNTASKIANIVGPSDILSDNNHIYSEKGTYNTVTGKAYLLDRSVLTNEGKQLTGDSLFYDRNEGLGEAFRNMVLTDTVNKNMMTGEYGYYNEKKKYAFATDKAVAVDYSQGDSLFLHGDTLLMETFHLDTDSMFREMRAFHKVRFYRTDMQGVCDSMQFNTRDSILYMYTDPIVWNEQYQIYGDTILIFMNDSSIDFAHVKQFAFAIQQIDSTAFNQLKGNDLKAYFEGQVVNQIDVSGNAESIFFPLEKDGSMVGMNETKSGFLTIWLKDNKLDKLKIWPTPTGTMTPIPDLKPDQKYLKDFYWFDYIRPKDKDDIYQVVKRKAQDAPKRSNKFVH